MAETAVIVGAALLAYYALVGFVAACCYFAAMPRTTHDDDVLRPLRRRVLAVFCGDGIGAHSKLVHVQVR